MSDKYSSPIEDIFDICQEEGEYNAFLLLGHRGCGKSTELNYMSEKFVLKGYSIRTIACSMDLDLFNIVYSDLFILMGEALLEIAKELNCKVDKNILEKIKNFWVEGEEILSSQNLAATSIEGGISAEPSGILSVLNIFARIKADLKYNEETRKEYRRKIITGFFPPVFSEIVFDTQLINRIQSLECMLIFLRYSFLVSSLYFSNCTFL